LFELKELVCGEGFNEIEFLDMSSNYLQTNDLPVVLAIIQLMVTSKDPATKDCNRIEILDDDEPIFKKEELKMLDDIFSLLFTQNCIFLNGAGIITVSAGIPVKKINTSKWLLLIFLQVFQPKQQCLHRLKKYNSV
jgi:hypothetical protein